MPPITTPLGLALIWQHGGLVAFQARPQQRDFSVNTVDKKPKKIAPMLLNDKEKLKTEKFAFKMGCAIDQ